VLTAHRRGAHAIGGMAAETRSESGIDSRALEQVRTDTAREALDGHDGTWVAHADLVGAAREAFDAHMPSANQLHDLRGDVRVTAADLLQPPVGRRTEAGLRQNVRVAIHYLEAWLGGDAWMPLDGRMEDAATAEISRSQVWQWLAHQTLLEDGTSVTPDRLQAIVWGEMEGLRRAVGSDRFRSGRFRAARVLFERLCTGDHLEDFLTVPAYDVLVDADMDVRTDRG
jgi:malate synthase